MAGRAGVPLRSSPPRDLLLLFLALLLASILPSFVPTSFATATRTVPTNANPADQGPHGLPPILAPHMQSIADVLTRSSSNRSSPGDITPPLRHARWATGLWHLADK